MAADEDEEALLRSVALQNAQSILVAPEGRGGTCPGEGRTGAEDGRACPFAGDDARRWNPPRTGFW